MLRCEIARLFGGYPHELLRIPLSEYRMLENYYLAVKDAERQAVADSSNSGQEEGEQDDG